MTSTGWKPPRPSVFTPFIRRFTDEKSRDIKETQRLFDAVSARHQESRWSKEDVELDVAELIIDEIDLPIPEPLQVPLFDSLVDILRLEKPIFTVADPETNLATLSLKELVDLRRFLRAQEHFLDHEEQALAALIEPLVAIFGGLLGQMPKLETPSPFTIPLIHLIPEPLLNIEKIYGTIQNERSHEFGVFAELYEQLYLNECRAHGLTPGVETRRAIKLISEMDMTPLEGVEAFCKATPFRGFLETPVPLKFDYETRFNHVHVVGGSGAGKTQLLQSLILSDLQADDPPSLVIVDSQSDLIGKIARLDVFHPEHGRLRDKLTLITPRDIDCPPAINIFDIDRGRLQAYDQATREQVVAGVIQTFDYLFAGLLGADLTAKQSVFFRFVARLMLALPEVLGRNATILDMMNLMDDPAPYREAIKSLPPIQRNFFERDFGNSGFRQTKEQIRYRLQAILENPTLARLFTSARTKIDIFAELNRGGIILIDTAKDFLKDSSAHFGRIFVSLVMQAALERAAIPERKRAPAFLIVDEAADYFDDNIDDLLTQVRKYKVGCLFAHQFMDQCSSSLRSSLSANTGTKLCAAVSTGDARTLAPDMRTTPDFILGQKKLHFACFVRNVTPEAVSVPILAGEMERHPKMTDADYIQLREANKRRVSTSFDAPDPQAGNGGSSDDTHADGRPSAPPPGRSPWQDRRSRPTPKPSTAEAATARTSPPKADAERADAIRTDDPNKPATEW